MIKVSLKIIIQMSVFLSIITFCVEGYSNGSLLAPVTRQYQLTCDDYFIIRGHVDVKDAGNIIAVRRIQNQYGLMCTTNVNTDGSFQCEFPVYLPNAADKFELWQINSDNEESTRTQIMREHDNISEDLCNIS